jgi:hypothetical protein
MEKELILKAIEYVNDIPSRVDEFLTKEKFAKEWNKDCKIYSKYYAGCDPVEEKPYFRIGQWAIRTTDMGGPHYKNRMFKIDSISTTTIGEGTITHCKNSCRPATVKEIADHLRGICDIKYVGKNVFPVGMSCDYRIYEWHSYDSPNDRVYYVSSHGTVCVYSKGLFADLAPEKKKLPRTKKELVSLLCEIRNRIVIQGRNSYGNVEETAIMTELLNEYED